MVLNIAVCGPGAEAEPDQLLLAYRVGELLAVAHHVVLTGGLDGVMAAAAAGCRTAGGVSVGLLPGESREAGSVAHTLLLPTGLGEMRNAMLVRAADAVIVVGNSWGTLSEVALAMRTEKPLAVLTGSKLPFDMAELPVEELPAWLDKLVL